MIIARKAGKVAYFANDSKLVIKNGQPSNYVDSQIVTKRHERPPTPTSSEGDDDVAFTNS